MNQPNNEGRPSAEAGEGRAQTKGGHRSIAHAPDTEREKHVPETAWCAASSLCRHASLVRAVCVNALIRICAGGDQRWSSLPRQQSILDESSIPTYRVPSHPTKHHDPATLVITAH